MRKVAFLVLVLLPLLLLGGTTQFPTGSGHIIEDAGTARPQRPTLNFSGTISCTDDAADNETDCVVSGDPNAPTSNSFVTWDTPEGTDIVAETGTDTVQFLVGSGVNDGIDIIGGGIADQIQFNFDATEVGDVTWGTTGDASIVWTFDPNGATNPTLTFSNNSIDASVFTIGAAAVQTGAEDDRPDKADGDFTEAVHLDPNGRVLWVNATDLNAAGEVIGGDADTATTATTATNLADDPNACPAGQFYSDLTAAGVSTCGTPASGDSVLVEGANVDAALGIDLQAGSDGIDFTFDDAANPETLRFDFDATEVGDETWGAAGDTTIQWTFDPNGTNPVLQFSTGVMNLSTGNLQQGGTQVVLESRTLTGGSGVDIGGSDAAQDLSANRTFTVDTTEIGDTTWGTTGDASMVWIFDPNGATNPTFTFANDSLVITNTGTLTVPTDSWGDTEVSNTLTHTGGSIDLDAGVGVTDIAAAQLIIGSGAGTSEYTAALTDCDDPNNSKLLFDLTSRDFSCGTDQGGGGGMTSFNATGDSGTSESITNGNTLTIRGSATDGLDGIDTVGEATDFITIQFDATEINDETWGSPGDATMVWVFDPNGATNPTISFSNDLIAITNAASTTFSGDITVSGGNIISGASTNPTVDFDDSDDAGTIDGTIQVNCPTATDCDMTLRGEVGGVLTTFIEFDSDSTDLGAAPELDVGTVHAGTIVIGGNSATEITIDTDGLTGIVEADLAIIDDSTITLTSEVSGTLPVANGGTNLTAAADDNVMVGNATTWETKAIGDCDDTSGNHLNYDTTTNAFSCGTSSSVTDTTCSSAACTVGTDDTITIEGGTTVTAIADDEVMVGSGPAAAAFVAIGDCDDTGGNHLNYDTATNTFSCGTSSSGGTPAWETITDPGGDQTLAMAEFNTTFNWTKDDDTAESAFRITYDLTSAASTTDQFLLEARRQDSGGAHADMDALVVVQNLDTNDAVTDAIRVAAAAGGVTNALNANDAQITNVIVTTGSSLTHAELDLIDGGVLITELTTGTKANLESILSDVADIAEADGDTYTGNHDFSGTGTFTIDVDAGAAPTANGVMAYDSTANQLEYGDNTVNRIVVNTDEAQTLTNKDLDASTNSVDLDAGTTVTGIAAAQMIIGSGAGTTEYTAALTDCDNATTSKLLWDVTTRDFSCGTDQDSGGTTAIDALGDVGAGDDTVGLAEDGQIWTWDLAADTAVDGLTLALQHDQVGTANIQRVLTVRRNDSAGAHGDVEALLRLQNADGDDEVDAAIDIDSAAGTITTAIDMSSANITNAIVTPNDTITMTELETIHDTVADGIITSSEVGTDLDFVDFADAMTLDATTTITMGDTETLELITSTTNATNSFVIDHNHVDDAGADAVDVMRIETVNESNDDDPDILVISQENASNSASIGVASAIRIENLELQAAGVMEDGILIQATTVDLIVDGIDVSDAELTNAINIGTNPIAAGANALTIGDGTNTSVTLVASGTANATHNSVGFKVVPPAAQTIGAGGTITADACGTLKEITAAGPVTTDTTNTFTAPAAANDGCIMEVCNTSANDITLDDNANFNPATAGDVVLSTDECISVVSDSTVWMEANQAGGGGADTNAVREICFDAASLQPLVANDVFAPLEKEAGTNLDILERAFDDAADECVTGKLKVPVDTDTGGTVTYRWWWRGLDITAVNAVSWEFKHRAIVGLNESWDAALTTDNLGSHSFDTSSVNEVVVDTDTATVSALGWAQNDLVYFQVCRDGDGTGATDDHTGDAYLHMFCLEIPRS